VNRTTEHEEIRQKPHSHQRHRDLRKRKPGLARFATRLAQGVALVAMLLALPAAALEQEVTTVTVMGEAVIEGPDLAQARRRGLQDAFTAAITQAMGAYLSANSFTRNFESIERGVYSRTEGYIKTYEILGERSTDGLLTLEVRVDVSNAPLKDDLTALGILLDAIGNPVMRVEGEEQSLAVPVAVRRFEEELARNGFQVQSSEAAAHDVLIRLGGRVQSTNEIGGLGMYGAVVFVEATATWQPGGRAIGSVAESANGAGLNVDAALQDAYAKAADKAFPTLLDRLVRAWQAERNAGRLVAIEVQAGDLAEITSFKQRLSRVFGVDKVDLKGFQPGRGELLVRFRGTTPELAELIQMTEFQNHSVRVTGVENNGLALSVAARR
jgi:hypothetical protein